MNGPSPAFLAQLNAGLNPLDAGAQLAGYGPPSAAPMVSGQPLMPVAPPPNASGFPSLDQAAPAPLPPAGPQAPPSAAGMSSPTEDPNALVSRAPPAMSQGPDSPAGGVEPKAPAPTAPPDVQFQKAGSTGTPAREVNTRGAKQTALLQSSFEPGLEVADRIQLRSGIQAQHESDVYEQQAEHALAQQSALERVAARRQQEMQQMRSAYDNTIQQLGNSKIDNGRLWGSMSTPDKIGATLLVMIGSAFGCAEQGMKLLNDRIEADVAQQKFDYQKGLDIAKGQQNAYGLAMEQYGSEDAAYHAAMASAQMATAAKINSMGAQWKGTNAANEADTLRASMLSGAARSAAEGYKYLQPTAGAAQFRMKVRGQELPGLVTGKEANAITLEHAVKPGEEADQALLKGGIQAGIEGQKERAASAKGMKEFQVVLPNGETINAPDKEEAGHLRELSLSVSKTQRLVAQAKEIRDSATFRASPEGRNKLGQIQKDLVTQFAVQNKLGALSNADMDLAVGGTADLFQFGNGVEARLDRLSSEAMKGRSERIATYPGAPAKSSGKMPDSFQAGK